MRNLTRNDVWLPMGALLSITAVIGCQWSGPRLALNSPKLTLCALREESVQTTPAIATPQPTIITSRPAATPATSDALTGQSEGTAAPNCDQAKPAPSRVCYEDALSGGRVFSMYCGSCHNARALGESPSASAENAANHMRVGTNLTDPEYRTL